MSEGVGLLLMLGSLAYFVCKLWAYERYMDAVLAYRQQEIEDGEATIAERSEIETQAKSTQNSDLLTMSPTSDVSV